MSEMSQMKEGGSLEFSEDIVPKNQSSIAVDDMPPHATQENLPLRAQVCGLLFVSSRPITVATIAEATLQSIEAVEEELRYLQAEIEPGKFGFELIEVADAWQFRTSSLLARNISRLAPPKARRLSKAASETLAVIAYRQPVGKADIDSIRGVDSAPTLRTLLDLKLIRGVGRASTPGHPILYGTTTAFLERFGLRDLGELPSLRELEEMVTRQASDSVEGDEQEGPQSMAELSQDDEFSAPDVGLDKEAEGGANASLS